MKKLILIVVTLVFSNSLSTSAQSSNTDYYVVIGGFAKKENAINYKAKAEKNTKLISIFRDDFKVEYELNSERNLYYVHILKTNDKKQAFAINIKLKAETEYNDSWVFAGDFGGPTSSNQSIVKNEPEIKNTPAKAKEPAKSPELPKQEIPVEEPKVAEQKPEIKSTPSIDSSLLAKKETPKPVEKKALAGKPFIFKLSDKASGKEVTGQVHVLESAKAAEYQAFTGNELAYLPIPDNKAGSYLIKIQAPGYKPTEKTIKFGLFDSLKVDQKETVIPFALVKVKSGDYIDFNNVHFIKNSPIMNPDSQNELDGLVALMKENPRYKIRVHGFCNGTSKREIIARGTSEKFFEVETDKNKKKQVSAKELSLERAEIVKAYLISQGIESNRVSVNGEGGDIPLYPEKGPLSARNDRIEIEIKSN